MVLGGAMDSLKMLLDTGAAAAYLTVSARYLEQLRCNGGGPAYKALPAARPSSKNKKHLIRYTKAALDTWVENLPECTNTAQAAIGGTWKK
jgi:hypothetical protein